MSVTATVEKVENGYVVDVAGAKFVATDCIDLASVFVEVFEVPETRVDLTSSGREALAGLDLRTGEELLVEHLLAKANGVASPLEELTVDGGDWPRVPAAEPSPPSPLASVGEGSQAEVRVPVADDGYEFPPVKQMGANHFVVVCPLHGDQRMERRGVAWVCPRKDKTAECTTRIPREAMQRALRAA